MAVEKMDVTPIATIQNELALATPVDTTTSFGCTKELIIDISKQTWVQNYDNGDYKFFRLKNPNNSGTQWYCIEAGGSIKGIYNMDYYELYDTYNETTQAHYACGHGAVCPGTGVPVNWSCPHMICVGNHLTQDSSYTNGNRSNPNSGETPWTQQHLYNVAYIVSYQNSDDLMYEIAQETYKIGQSYEEYLKTYNILEALPSDDPNGWSGAKQAAIWRTIISDNKYSDSELDTYHKEFVKQGEKLNNEANAFYKYYSYIKNTEYVPTGKIEDEYAAYVGEKDVGFGLKDETNNDGVYTFVDQEVQGEEGKVKYTIGPFKINYVNGTQNINYSYLGNAALPYVIGFSGMSDAYLVDDKGNRIEINKFIITKDMNGNAYTPHLQLTPTYFDTLNQDGTTNKNLIDRYACRYKSPTRGYIDENGNWKDLWNHVITNKETREGQGYPFPLEEFYVEFYATEEMSTKVKVHMDFKWLDASMQICLKEGRKYYSYFAEERGGGYCPVIIGWYACDCDEWGCSSCPIYCNTWYHVHVKRVDRAHYYDQQDNMEVVSTERIQHDESIELDNNGQYFDLTMQIGGFVWEDMNEYSKEGCTVTGTYQAEDASYQGIEVILHEYNKKKNESKIVRRTVTDKKGYYMFKDVDSRKKYYVEFVFDGQKYENTKYTEYSPKIYNRGKFGYKKALEEHSLKAILAEDVLKDNKEDNDIKIAETLVDKETGEYVFPNGIDGDYTKSYYVKIVSIPQGNEDEIVFKKSSQEIYIPTIHGTSNATETTNADDIELKNSNDQETFNARDQYNERFEEIGSYPENYQVRNPIKAEIAGKLYRIGEYNTSYNWTEMVQEGKNWIRVESDIAKLYDAVRTKASNIAQKSTDGRVGNVQDPYTQAYKEIAVEMQNGSVQGLEGKYYTPTETVSMLQFLEDRRLSAYTGENGLTGESQKYYVIKEYHGKFVIATRNEVDNPDTQNNLAKTGIHKGYGKIQIGTTTYTAIYDGAYRDYDVKEYREYIDARTEESDNVKAVDKEIKITSQLRVDYGITRRMFSDAALTQDLYKVTTKINGKTEVYDYDVREVAEEEFHIEQRVDSGDYYNITYDTAYNRGLYKSDWLYSADMYEKDDSLNTSNNTQLWETLKNAKSTTELAVYATYRVTISNQGNTNIDIQEIVDYYDEEYIFEPNLSFTVYNDATIDKDNFYDAMHNSTLTNIDKTKRENVQTQGGFTLTQNDSIEKYLSNETQRVPTTGLLEKTVKDNYTLGSTSKYNAATTIEQYRQDPNILNATGYNAVYITTPQGTEIEPGNRLYMYLTFRVKRATDSVRIILDEGEGTQKHNVTEINGYKTYYHGGSILPRYNGQNQYEIKDNTNKKNRIAGIIDTDSTPGNVTAEEPAGEAHDINEVYFYEDDTDRASDFTVTLYTNPRKMNGYVWEDERTVQSANAMVGDGIRANGEPLVNGVTVQLVELIDAGNEGYYEYIWKEVSSGEIKAMKTGVISVEEQQNYEEEDNAEKYKGFYEFHNFITGNYIIRFKYGDTYKTALSTEDGNYSYDTDATEINAALGSLAQNATSYNGQDYKSTTYQAGIAQETVTTADPIRTYGNSDGYGYVYFGDLSVDETGNIKNQGQNTTGSYVYDIGAADNKQNLSDAKDIYFGYTQQYDSAENGRTNYDKIGSNGATTETGGYISALNRYNVIDYSNNDVTNHKAEVLASPYEIPTYKSENGRDDVPYDADQMRMLVDELMAYTQMRAETGIIDVEYEYNRRVSDEVKQENSTISGELHFGAGAVQVNKDDTNKGYTGDNDKNGTYVLSNIDFGLQQRPQAQLELDKRVNNVKVTLANGNVLFDASQKATNVLWLAKGEHTVTRNEVDNTDVLGIITEGNVIGDSEKGKIQLTMDEEIMHGATIQITYQLQVENTGEYDYNNAQFYYTGTINEGDTETSIVKTKVDELVDYINNNMEYRQVDNEYTDDENTNTDSSIKNNKWEVIGKEQLIIPESDYRTNANLVNVNLQNQVNEFNTIVHITESPFLEELKTSRNQDDATEKFEDRAKNAESTRTIQLLLTQTLDPESDTDEMTYANIAEIAKTSNTVGRRMAVSVVGNQDPEQDIAEIDADVSEDVVILPPFGDDQSKLAIWTIIGVAVVALLGTGIILIKRFVIKK